MGDIEYHGIGFFGMLGILFIGLKLGRVIDWSWVWVLAPLWGPVALLLIVLCAALVILAIVTLIAKIFR